MGLKLNTSSGGSVSIEPTNTASNYTLTVPAQTGTVIASDSSGNVGIGMTNQSQPLMVKTDTDFVIGLGKTSAGSGARVGAYNSALSAYKDIVVDGESVTFATSGAAQARITSAGLMQFNSGYGSVATAYGCRAWVCFNAQLSPATILNSGGVSSLTDNGVGSYRVNLSFTMPDTNYACVMGFQRISGSGDTANEGFSRGTTSTAVEFFSGGTQADPAKLNVAFIR